MFIYPLTTTQTINVLWTIIIVRKLTFIIVHTCTCTHMRVKTKKLYNLPLQWIPFIYFMCTQMDSHCDPSTEMMVHCTPHQHLFGGHMIQLQLPPSLGNCLAKFLLQYTFAQIMKCTSDTQCGTTMNTKAFRLIARNIIFTLSHLSTNICRFKFLLLGKYYLYLF